MKICIAGRNTLAIRCTSYLINNFGFKDIIAVPSIADKGIDRFEPSFKKFCNENNISTCTLEDTFEIRDMILFSLQYDRILVPKKFFSSRLFNIHFSLLPMFKGMYPSIWPILLGYDYSGVTIHFIDEGIDTGDIIDQIKYDIDITDTAKTIYLKNLQIGEEIFIKNLNDIIKGKTKAYPQPATNSTYFSKDSIDFKNIKIDLNKTSFQIHNQIRAFIFEEFQLPIIDNKKITKSCLTTEKIKKNQLIHSDKKIILSGIDGYKIILDTK